MSQFMIPAMSCGRCVAAITQAIQSLDPEAELDFDLASRSVRIDSSLPAAALETALGDAGYTPQGQAPAAPTAGCCSAPADRAAAPRRGCCCG